MISLPWAGTREGHSQELGFVRLGHEGSRGRALGCLGHLSALEHRRRVILGPFGLRSIDAVNAVRRAWPPKSSSGSTMRMRSSFPCPCVPPTLASAGDLWSTGSLKSHNRCRVAVGTSSYAGALTLGPL